MTDKEKLFNVVYDLAQNMHDTYQLHSDMWEKLASGLDVLWSTAYSEGHAAGKEEAWIESGKDF